MKTFPRLLYLAAGLMLAVTLSACSGCSTTGSKATPPQAVFQIKQQYEIALAVAVAYKNLPDCAAPAAPKICSSKDVVGKLNTATSVARPALDAAEAAVRDPTFDDSAAQAAIVSARQALLALTAITAKLPKGTP